jgi:putative oxidoreductase
LVEKMRILDKLQPLGLLAMRIALGAVMIVHGYPKVTGIHGVEKFFSGVGLPWWSAYLSAGAEFFGGILIIAGLLTRFFGLALLIDMIVAIDKVHWKNGLTGEGNYQWPMTLAALGLALIFFGAGPIALDAVIGLGRGRSRKTTSTANH